jgi:hypothetical protein
MDALDNLAMRCLKTSAPSYRHISPQQNLKKIVHCPRKSAQSQLPWQTWLQYWSGSGQPTSTSEPTDFAYETILTALTSGRPSEFAVPVSVETNAGMRYGWYKVWLLPNKADPYRPTTFYVQTFERPSR